MQLTWHTKQYRIVQYSIDCVTHTCQNRKIAGKIDENSWICVVVVVAGVAVAAQMRVALINGTLFRSGWIVAYNDHNAVCLHATHAGHHKCRRMEAIGIPITPHKHTHTRRAMSIKQPVQFVCVRQT